MSLTVCHVTFINVMIWVSQKRRHKRLLIILYSIIFIVTKFFTIPNWPIQVRELILDSDPEILDFLVFGREKSGEGKGENI